MSESVGVTVTCQWCFHSARMPHADITVMECTSYGELNQSYYKFICPSCHKLNHKHADRRLIDFLQSGGVQKRYFTIDTEFTDMRRRGGSPLTEDEVLLLMAEIEGSPDLISDVKNTRRR